ncbi:MAG: DUF362 domain-containing protein [Clostridia bacterium]|nr:DUF362 domain-containing protein [Clostridia bacterium]
MAGGYLMRICYCSFVRAVLVFIFFGAFAIHGALPDRSSVVVVRDREATETFRAQKEELGRMMRKGIAELMQSPDAAAGILKLVKPEDVVGIKVYALKDGPGGTRPEVVRALIELLGEAGVAAEHIVIWDRSWEALNGAGFVKLARETGVQIQATAEAGFDESVFYSSFFPSSLIYGDVEFSKDFGKVLEPKPQKKPVIPPLGVEPKRSEEEQPGRRSFVSKLLTQKMTRLILVTPLTHHNSLGAAGHIYSLASGCTDNFLRFEADAYRLAEAAAEIYAMEAVGDRVALCITDALFCQYRGQSSSFLHYSLEVNELWFSKDPAALDALAFGKMMDIRRDRAMAAGSPTDIAWAGKSLLENAVLLELGNASEARINIRRFDLSRNPPPSSSEESDSQKGSKPPAEETRTPWWKIWKL